MKETILIVLLWIVMVVVVGLLIMFPIMWLWNWLMPSIFGLGEITAWQALGLYTLCQTLFGSKSSSSKK